MADADDESFLYGDDGGDQPQDTNVENPPETSDQVLQNLGYLGD